MARRLSIVVIAFLALFAAVPLSAQNLITNGTFDNGLNGWEQLGAASVSGGVLTLTTTFDEFLPISALFQCVAVQPGQRYRLATSFRVAQGSLGNAFSAAGFFPDSTCENDESEEGIGLFPEATGAWEDRETFMTAPPGSLSALVALFLIAPDVAVSAEFDNVVFAVDDEPRVAIVDFPEALVQSTTGGATASFTVQNVGRGPTQVTLSQSGTFFSQSPTSFALAPDQSQVVTVTGLAVAPGSYDGASILAGAGVPAGLSVRVRLVASAPPGGPVVAAPSNNRLDLVSTNSDALIPGTATFTNSGTGTLSGILTTDVPWIIPQSGIITIPAGQSVVVTFTIDPKKRTDAGELGSATGTLFLEYLAGSALKIGVDTSPGAASSTVVVVHTVSPGSSPGVIPALAPGELALFIPGIAHAPGSVGTFISDLSMASLNRSGSLRNINLYFRPIGPGTTPLASAIQQIVSDRPLLLGDIASTVFGNTSTSGTLQVRGESVDRISAAANVFNASNPRGTFGTGIPVFRSDRSAGAGERIFLTGVRANATSHTNIYVQEASGAPASFGINFFDAQGVPMGSATGSLEPFALVQLQRVVPEGAVSALVTTATGSAGRLLAYATPVDRASGDTWAVADWNRYYSFSGAMIVPVAGSARGANDTYFRTDVAIANAGNTAAAGELRFVSRTGETRTRPISLGAMQSQVVTDVLVNLFGLSEGQVGYLVFQPVVGNVRITSRTYTTVQGQAATFGSGVPTVPANFGVTQGQLRRYGGIEDSSLASLVAQRAGTFRTNVGLVETSGQSATVRLTLRFSTGTQPSAVQAVVARVIDLAPGQFLQLNRISVEVLGPERDARYGDLRNMQLDIEVIAGAGSVVSYTSSVDNGTGDSILRID